jgi:hypothetical protein
LTSAPVSRFSRAFIKTSRRREKKETTYEKKEKQRHGDGNACLHG